MANIFLSRAQSADAAGIASVHYDSWRTQFQDMLPTAVYEKMTSEFVDNFWHNYFQGAANSIVFVAKIDKEVVGFIAMKLFDEPEFECDCEIDKIYVSPHAQGKGIGSRLMKYAFSELKSQGFKKALVKVYIKNKKAEQFYLNLGATFVKEEEIVDYHSLITSKIYTLDL